jgi:hypothetical protein
VGISGSVGAWGEFESQPARQFDAIRFLMNKLHPKTLILIIAVGLPLLFLSGCASGYTRGPEAKGIAEFKASSANPVSKVTVELTPEVKEKLKDSLKFDQQSLLGKIELALSNHELLNKAKKDGATELHVTVTHVRVRNTFNAVMWGAMSGNDSIEGDVTIKDGSGATLDQFHVDSSYALGGFAGGQDSVRMNWLYEAFSTQVVSALTGEDKKH